MKRIGFAGLAVAAALLLAITLLSGGSVLAQDDNGVPLPGTVNNSAPVTVISSKVITADQNTAAIDISRYNGADLFVTVDVAADSALTTTLQFGGDNTHFADGYWYSTDLSGTLVSHAYQVIQTADGTSYIRTAYAGQFGRLALDVTGTVTVTTAILAQKNN
jgi:hypothetical protein